MSEHNNNSNTDSVISVRAMDIITALAFIAVGLVVMTGSIKLGASWGSDGPENVGGGITHLPGYHVIEAVRKMCAMTLQVP